MRSQGADRSQIALLEPGEPTFESHQEAVNRSIDCARRVGIEVVNGGISRQEAESPESPLRHGRPGLDCRTEAEAAANTVAGAVYQPVESNLVAHIVANGANHAE
ncbi:hypothetical protein [Kitasatospora phosalacinea]|uniref:hypothetical protein n=1 Tax=Kitasatospora phosalacinea TaxID=2065 RepID=UPI003673B894